MLLLLLRSVFCIYVYESCKGFDKVRRWVGLYVGLFWRWQQEALGIRFGWLSVAMFPFSEKLGFSTFLKAIPKFSRFFLS